jgi:hydroxymethylglutaryl-CoA reductase
MVKNPVQLVIADTGINSSTSTMVAGVRKRFDQNRDQYQLYLDSIEGLVIAARTALQDGNITALAEAMNENHRLLQQMEVSSFALDRLVKTAKTAGALAAKLIGAGGGGNMIALCTPENVKQVGQALNSIGAVRVFSLVLSESGKIQ